MKDIVQSVKLMIAAVFALMPGIASQAAAKPLKVFILAGQSNMQGWIGVSSLDSMADDPKTAPILKEMRNADGTPRVCRKVWISSIGCAGDDTTEQKGKLTVGFGAEQDRFGPEFPFGIYLEKLLGEPILIIKTSWGGKSLHTDFRPPGAGPYVWSDYELAQCKRRGDDLEKDKADKVKATGVYYRLMIEHVRKVLADINRVVPDYDPKQGYKLAGFLWFQGWNDLCADWTYDKRMQSGGYDMYGQLLAKFIRDVRKDLSAPKVPFVIGVVGMGGVKEASKPPMLYFCQAQAAPAPLPEFKGNVAAVQTAPYWDDDLAALQERADKKEKLTPEELKRLKGVSHTWRIHYLGAAKIMAPIGKAFAEAMANLQKTQGQEMH